MRPRIGVTALACFLAASCADETPSAKTEMDVVRTLDPPSDPCDVRHHAGRIKLHVNIASDGKVILVEAFESTFSQDRTTCFLEQIRRHHFNPPMGGIEFTSPVVFTLDDPGVDAGLEGWHRTQAE